MGFEVPVVLLYRVGLGWMTYCPWDGLLSRRRDDIAAVPGLARIHQYKSKIAVFNAFQCLRYSQSYPSSFLQPQVTSRHIAQQKFAPSVSRAKQM